MSVDQEQYEDDGVPLAEAITLLRKELQEAMETGAGKDLKFSVDSIELELAVVVDVRKKAEAKFSLWKVSAGGGRDRGRSDTHRLKLTLKPRDTTLPAGDETLIGDDEEF
ncbi:hypothetical protein Mame01_53340 [Microbispora amethystogenes]|nr:hypothetical protein Mame01_53340 [Microbispora amethystogenes]